ncbi:MAG: hypothetical protein IT383_20370 [Deltaproteobacteria bacterium]|nr:hypothetical protein [Deltaproteobacteria bacterium]
MRSLALVPGLLLGLGAACPQGAPINDDNAAIGEGEGDPAAEGEGEGEPGEGEGEPGEGEGEPGEGEGEGEPRGCADEEDCARIVSAEFPATLACNAEAVATVVVQNAGTATWTRASHRLGGVDDSDPFHAPDARIYLPDDVEVAPGADYSFSITLRAPSTAGSYSSDWRMVHELVRWFGDSVVRDIVVQCEPHHARAGLVRAHGHVLEDDEGPFVGLGATMMWAAWGYQHDRARLEQNLAFLAEHGFDYIRALGTVGDPTRGDDYWEGREIDPSAPGFDDAIAGLTDLAYDVYGLRVEWTIFGGTETAPTEGEQQALIDRFLAMSVGREHKILHFETGNESWHVGFEGDEGTDRLRRLTRYLRDRTDILVAASAPASADCEGLRDYYEGEVADLATVHFDRNPAEEGWRPVRQPWGLYREGGCGFSLGIVASNNEPIGPGASVASDEDPERLAAAAITTYVANIPLYVFHSRAGVRGDVDLFTMAGVDAFTHVKDIVPPDVTGWQQWNHYQAEAHPFLIFATLADGTRVPNSTWTDEDGAVAGVVRAYAARAGGEFLVSVIGVKGAAELEARFAMSVDVIEPVSGAVATRQLQAGERITLSGHGAFALRGHAL